MAPTGGKGNWGKIFGPRLLRRPGQGATRISQSTAAACSFERKRDLSSGACFDCACILHLFDLGFLTNHPAALTFTLFSLLALQPSFCLIWSSFLSLAHSFATLSKDSFHICADVDLNSPHIVVNHLAIVDACPRLSPFHRKTSLGKRSWAPRNCFSLFLQKATCCPFYSFHRLILGHL
ncbi:hypothetical protein F4819DRAFT_420170 [Hypoxylon fuscum]|nr:hypothetical protein F4819DRAFT_420170 [Hypoxylon fuscum]